MKLDLMVGQQFWNLGNVELLFMGQIELFTHSRKIIIIDKLKPNSRVKIVLIR